MSFMSPLACMLGRCRPMRGSYRWDAARYVHVGVCRHCDKPIERIGHRKWARIEKREA